MLRKLLILSSILAAAFFTATPTFAGTHPGIQARLTGTHHHGRNAPAATEICNNASNLLVCMNRQGNGTTPGTPIIGYNPGEENNDFHWLQEKDLCGGYVTSTCPNLGNTAFNRQWDGSIIVRIYAYNENLCLVDGVTNPAGYYTSQLNGCNNVAHSYILVGCGSTSCLGNQFSQVVNVTDMYQAGGTPKCLAWGTTAIPYPLITDDDCSIDAQSHFQEAYWP